MGNWSTIYDHLLSVPSLNEVQSQYHKFFVFSSNSNLKWQLYMPTQH